MLGPFATTSRRTPIHQMSLAVLSRAACASMSTTTSTTTTTMRDRGDRYKVPRCTVVVMRQVYEPSFWTSKEVGLYETSITVIMLTNTDSRVYKARMLYPTVEQSYFVLSLNVSIMSSPSSTQGSGVAYIA